MSLLQSLGTVVLVFAIGYAALYEAETTRDPSAETEVGGVPVRFLSLMFVSFGSVTVLALLFDAPDTFLESAAAGEEPLATALKAVSVGSIFSVVGAATADSVFSS